MTKKEREFIRLLLQQDAQIKRLYSETITGLAGDLKKFKPPGKVIVDANSYWVRNKAIEARIEKKLSTFAGQFANIIDENRAKALGVSKKHSDDLINSYLSNLPISQIAKEGINLRSLEGFNTFKNSIPDVSPQVWKTAQVLKDQLAFYGGSGIASGQSAKRISTDLKSLLEHPDKRFRRIRDPKTGKLMLSQPAKNFHPGRGVYRSSHKNALRLAQSETNMAFRHADQARWKEMTFVNGYEVKLSPQHPEDDICNHMAGAYPKSFLFGGWHPKCICFTVPILAPRKDFLNYLKTGQLNKNRIVTSIPAKAGRYVKALTPAFKRWKSKPHFITDNYVLKNGVYVPEKSVAEFIKVPPNELMKVTKGA